MIVQKLHDKQADIDDVYDDVIKKIDACLNITASDGLSTCKMEFDSKKRAAVALITETIKNIQALEKDLPGADKVRAKELGDAVADAGKLPRKSAVSDFTTMAGKAKKHVVDFKKAEAKKGQLDIPAESAPQSPLFVILNGLGDGHAETISKSVFEAKGGVRLAALDQRVEFDAAHSVKSNAYVKKCMKELAAHMANSGQNYSHILLREIPKVRKITSLLKKGFDQQLFTKHVLPDEPWAEKLLTYDIVGCAPGFTSILTTAFGGVECRLVLDGSEVIVGIPYGRVAGNTFAEKRVALTRMTIDNIRDLITSAGGFATRVKASDDQIIMIPSGFVLLTASEGSKAMRWNVSADDADKARTKFMLSAVLASFPEFRQPSFSYSSFLEWLEAS